jgi:aryl-alcohol dehydrogenase-like predicted oxidoreductase
VQDELNLLSRGAEARLLPYCRSRDLAFLAYAPLAQGLLTGKYRSGRQPAGSRLDRLGPERAARIRSGGAQARADAFAGLCARREADPAQVALAWVLSRPGVTAAVAGASGPEQVRNNAAAVGLELGADFAAEIDGVVTSWPDLPSPRGRSPSPAPDRSHADTSRR